MPGQRVENTAGRMNNVFTFAHHSFWPKAYKKAPEQRQSETLTLLFVCLMPWIHL